MILDPFAPAESQGYASSNPDANVVDPFDFADNNNSSSPDPFAYADSQKDSNSLDPFDFADSSNPAYTPGKPASSAEPEQGFGSAFMDELAVIGNQYANAAQDPAGTLEGIMQAGEALLSGDVDFGRAFGGMADAIADNPAAAAGQFVAQLINPINYIPGGVGVAAGKLALKAGKAGAVAGGALAGGASGAVTNVADLGMVAASQDREVSSAEAGDAALVGAGMGTAMSAVPAHIVAGKVQRAELEAKAQPIIRETLKRMSPEELKLMMDSTEFNRNLNMDDAYVAAQELGDNPNIADPFKDVVRDEQAPIRKAFDSLDVKDRGVLMEQMGIKEKATTADILKTASKLKHFDAGKKILTAVEDLQGEYGYVPHHAQETFKGIVKGLEASTVKYTPHWVGNTARYASDKTKLAGKKIVEYTPDGVKKVGKGTAATAAAVAKLVAGKEARRVEETGISKSASAYFDIAEWFRGTAQTASVAYKVDNPLHTPIDSMQHVVDTTAGKMKSAVKEALRGVKEIGIFQAVKSKEFNAGSLDKKVSDDLRIDITQESGPKTPIGIKIADALEFMHKTAMRLEVPLGWVPGYLPRRFNKDYLMTPKGGRAFVRLLRNEGFPELQAEHTLSTLINSEDPFAIDMEVSRMVMGDDGLPVPLERGDVSRASGSQERTLAKISDDKLREFLDDGDVRDLLYDYADSMARHIAYVSRFGADNSKLNAKVLEAAEQAKEAGTPLNSADISQVYDLADSIRFAKKPLDLKGNTASARADQAINVANKIFVPLVHLAFLPLTTISSLAEISIPMFKTANRPKAYWKGLGAAIGTARTSVRQAFKDVPPHEATRAIDELNIGFNAGFKRLMDSLTHHESNIGASISTAFFRLTFLDAWTRFSMVTANETGKAMIVGHLKDIADGSDLAPAYIKDLNGLNVDWRKGVEWIKNGADEADPYFQDQVKGGGLTFTQQTIMLPNPSELPGWHTNPRFRLIAQLKTFPTMFGNTVLPQWGKVITKGSNQERAVLAGTVAAAVSIGMVSNEISDYIRYGEDGNSRRDDDTIADTLLRGLDRSGIPGMSVLLADMAKSPEYGRSWVTAALGPTASIIEGGISTQQRADKIRAMSRFMASMLPIGNINKDLKNDIADNFEQTLKSMF
jgi:hypothetical protein